MLQLFLSALAQLVADVVLGFLSQRKSDDALKAEGRAEAAAEINAQTASKVDEMAQVASREPDRAGTSRRMRDGTF